MVYLLHELNWYNNIFISSETLETSNVVKCFMQVYVLFLKVSLIIGLLEIL
jgi:hypothetical protein